MNLFKHVFPKGSVVSVTCSENGDVTVGVNTPRPNPVWLKKTSREVEKLNGMNPGNSKFSEPEIDSKMFDLICAHPGHAKSHYTQMSRSAGGFGASQERKEQSITRLLLAGKVFNHMLENRVGRKGYEIWPAR